ncbi:right-handed parallel beta-helix repeat-containing protein [Streptomyces scabiei]|uniref:right-handed parallel beta-helix repeat-containing protein n=1 Tax=Streptomyces scabiei TaxID=1930 RepID=UPI001B305CF8|nr:MULTISPECIES: right-handed parallel beta-helix repeat-containing protein [unclassified Streptomyces]MBP5884559.1 plasmin and fibronectin-binding protein A [Streptomyces sp. LBUM 1487]QTU47596.1 plasmin and fibronectin-binding protein A [Streptomyces sp. LBUM 1482]
MATPVEEWFAGMDITAGRLESMNQRSAFQVTNFGADSSGTGDASPGIQLALNAARDVGGAQVIVPPGVYLIGATLRIYTNTRLTLMAGAEFRRNVASTMIINGDAGQSLGGYTGHSRIVIEGGLWNMRGTTAGLTASAMCISIGHATDIVIRDLEVRDLPGFHAVEMNSTSHGLVANCQFRGYVDPGGRDFSEAVQLDLAKSSSVFGGFGPYDHTPTQDVLVTGCHFGASGTAGTTAWPRGIGSHSATITKWHRRIRISDCSFEGVLQYAISAYNWEDVTVTGNTFLDCGSGVRLRTVIVSDPEDTKLPDGTPTGASQNMRNVTVSGNSFRGGLAYDEPIIALGETTGTILNLAVTGNVIDGSTSGQAGIRLQEVSRATVVGNSINNVNGSAVSTENCNSLAVDSNIIYNCASHGVTVVTGTNVNVDSNIVREPGGNGILVQGGTFIQLRNNYVRSAGRTTNNTFYGVRISTAADSLNLSGNKVRPHGSGNEAAYALSIASGVTTVSRYGNDWRGTYATSQLQDGSTSPNTTATDLT